jgi:hypothetical protein
MSTDEMRDILSQMASGSYEMGKKNTRKSDKMRAANRVKGFHVDPRYSDANITTYISDTDPTKVAIAHRGTDVSGKKGLRDVQSDLQFAMGIGRGYEDRFKRRQARSEEIIKRIEQEHGRVSELHLTGHSLGGGTMNYALANSKLLQDRLTSAHTFNAAANPIFYNETDVDKHTKSKLDNLVTHHRIENDPVSAGFLVKTPYGKVQTYKVAKKKKKKNLFRRLLDKHPIMRLKNMSTTALDAHMMDNFTENPMLLKNV